MKTLSQAERDFQHFQQHIQEKTNMGIFQKIFRKKQTIRSYKDSPNREGYERVAAKLQLPPDYIYEISHRGG